MPHQLDSPPSAETLFHEGTRLFMAGDIEASEASYRRALELARRQFQALLNFAVVLA